MRFIVTVCTIAAVSFWQTIASAQDSQPTSQPAKEEKNIGDAYPLATCPVSGQKLGSMGEPIVKEYDGREVRFCCDACPAAFEKDMEKYLAEIDKKIVEQQKEFYPLDKCIVTGDKLGSRGTIEYVNRNRLFRLCCKACVSMLEKNPGGQFKKLDKAVVKKQIDDYALDVCVVTGAKLGLMGDPIDYVHANRLVRFCCKGCIDLFIKNPLNYSER